MAQNLAATVTLQQIKTNVRRRTGKLDPQASGLLDTQLTDLIHSAILAVRIQNKAALDLYYQRADSVTFSAISSGIATVSIATLNLADISDPRLSATLTSTANKQIPIYDRATYNQIKSDYSTTTMTTTGAVGTIYLTSATPNVLTLEIYTGASSIASAVFSYLKNPIKVTADADTVDIPDHFAPLVEELTAQYVFGMPQLNKEKAAA